MLNTVKTEITSFINKNAKVILAVLATTLILVSADCGYQIYKLATTDREGGVIYVTPVAVKANQPGMHLTTELEDAIKRKEVNTDGIFVAFKVTNSNSEIRYYLSDDRGNPIRSDIVYISNVNYTKKTDNCQSKKYVGGTEPANYGYYEYTIDLVK